MSVSKKYLLLERKRTQNEALKMLRSRGINKVPEEMVHKSIGDGRFYDYPVVKAFCANCKTIKQSEKKCTIIGHGRRRKRK